MTQTLFVNDPFNGTPGDVLGAASPGWQKVPGVTGDAFITSGGDRLRFSGSTLYYLGSAPAPGPDYSATIELYIASTTSGPGVGVAVRLAGNAQTYYLARLLIGTGIQLYRVLGGTSTLLGSAPYSAVAGAMPRLRLEATGSALNVYVDDAPTPVISATDTAIPDAGYVGIRSINAASQLLVESLTASSESAAGVITNGTAAPVGTASAGQIGAVGASGSATGAAPGAVATAQVNASVTGSAGAKASPEGIGAAASTGVAATSAGARAAAAGVAVTSAVGAATAVGGSASAASPSGVSAAMAVGDVLANGAASCSPTGASAIASVGLASASAVTAVSGSAPAPGVGAVGAVASAGAAMATGGAGVVPAAVSAYASVGDVIAAGTIQLSATAEPFGVVAHGHTGTAMATGGGQFVRAPAGSGYTPRRHEYQPRPALMSTDGRPPAIQENYR